MSEFWVSRDKYYCKYCKIYIADDKPSRTLHETGLRHKGNYDRYIRDIYKRSERDQKDKAEEAREIARIDAAAHAAMQTDGTASTSSAPLPAAGPAPRARPTAAASTDPFSNYSTAESLGYVDVEGERVATEAELRMSEGRIGQWEKVVRPRLPPVSPRENVKREEVKEEDGEEVDADAEKERLERLEERPSSRFFKEKTRALADEDLYDPSAVGIKLKRKRLTLKEEEELQEREREKQRVKKEKLAAKNEEERQRIGTTTAGWNAIEVGQEEESMFMFEAEPKAEEDVKAEAPGHPPTVEGVKVEDEVADAKPAIVAGGGFKKRKMLGAAAARRKAP